MNAIIKREEFDKVVGSIEHAHTLPGQAYTSDAFFNAEAEHLFKSEWFPVCHEQMLPNPGDFYTLDVFNEKLVAVRGDDGEIRVLDRRCLDSGADLFISPFVQGRCEDMLGDLLRHRAWVYNLRGELIEAPNVRDETFDLGDHRLNAYRTETWKGFVMVNIDGRAEPFAEGAKVLERWVENYDLENLVRLPSIATFEMDTNWKLVAENYIEAYHHLAIHRNTFEPVSPARNTFVEDLEGSNDKTIVLNMPIEKAIGEGLGSSLPPIEGLSDEDLATFPVWLVMPFFLLVGLHTSVAWLQLVPLGPDKSMWIIHTFFPASSLQEPEKLHDTLSGGIAIHNEDMDACVGNQKGIVSRFFEQGRLHPTEKGVWYFDKYILETIAKKAPELIA